MEWESPRSLAGARLTETRRYLQICRYDIVQQRSSLCASVRRSVSLDEDLTPTLNRQESEPIPVTISPWEIQSSRVNAVAGESFEVTVRGWSEVACQPFYTDQQVLQDPLRIQLRFRKGFGDCSPSDLYFWEETVRVEGVPSGRYLLDVLYDPGVPEWEVARTELLVVGPSEPRVEQLDLTVNEDTSVAVTARLATPNCGEQSYEYLGAQVRGRDIVVYLQSKRGQSNCSGARSQEIVETLGYLDPARYRVVAELAPDGMDSATEFLGQSGRLIPLIKASYGVATDEASMNGSPRFRTRVSFATQAGTEGEGRVVTRSKESVLFSFFEGSNWELMVKVLDGCSLTEHFWVYSSASTDLAYLLEVFDTETGRRWSFTNAPGERSPATTDVKALPCH